MLREKYQKLEQFTNNCRTRIMLTRFHSKLRPWEMKIVAKSYDTILDILPEHPSSEQNPAHRVRPLLMTINFPSFIGP